MNLAPIRSRFVTQGDREGTKPVDSLNLPYVSRNSLYTCGTSVRHSSFSFVKWCHGATRDYVIIFYDIPGCLADVVPVNLDRSEIPGCPLKSPGQIKWFDDGAIDISIQLI
jgi:hypothetical protein